MEFRTKTCIFVTVLECVCGCVLNLSEQTHLPEVVVSLLQSGELSQETLVLSSLLIQLCPQSCTLLRHSLLHTLCKRTHKEKQKHIKMEQ